MNKYFKNIIAVLAFTIGLSFVTLAENPGDPSDVIGGGGIGQNSGGAVPIDGGASLLIASGVAYGVREIRKRKAAAKKAA